MSIMNRHNNMLRYMMELLDLTPVDVYPELDIDGKWSRQRFNNWCKPNRDWPPKWYRPLRKALRMGEAEFYDIIRNWYK